MSTKYEEHIQLNDTMRDILRKVIGKRLLSIKTNKAVYKEEDFIGAIGLFFDDGTVISVENQLQPKQHYENQEDCGTIVVKDVDINKFSTNVSDEVIVEYKINKVLNGIKIITDHIEDSDSEVSFMLTMDEAIVLEFESDAIVLEKDWIFSEVLKIHRTKNYMQKLRPIEKDWLDSERHNNPKLKRIITTLQLDA